MARKSKFACKACKDRGVIMEVVHPVRIDFDPVFRRYKTAVRYLPCTNCEKGKTVRTK